MYLSTRDTDVVGALVEVRAALRAKPIARREKQLRADASSRRRGEDLRKTDKVYESAPSLGRYMYLMARKMQRR